MREHSVLLSGVVRSAAGAIVNGARVCESLSEDDCCAQPRCVVTDARGQFNWTRRDVEEDSLVVLATGYLMHTESLGALRRREESAAGVVITLEEAAAEVSGVVVDSSGGPIEGACISARTSQAGAVVANDFSDAAGAFSLAVPLEALAVAVRAEAYDRATRDVAPPASNLAFALSPASIIVGSVVAEGTGEPLGGVSVVAEGSAGLQDRSSTQTEADGSFRFGALSAGAYGVSVLSDGWQSEKAWASAAVGQASAPLVLRARPALSLKVH